MNKNFRKGFSEAFEQLKICEREQATKELMAILGIKNRASFHQYRLGSRIPKADKAQEIENYFLKMGVCDVYR